MTKQQLDAAELASMMSGLLAAIPVDRRLSAATPMDFAGTASSLSPQVQADVSGLIDRGQTKRRSVVAWARAMLMPCAFLRASRSDEAEHRRRLVRGAAKTERLRDQMDAGRMEGAPALAEAASSGLRRDDDLS